MPPPTGGTSEVGSGPGRRLALIISAGLLFATACSSSREPSTEGAITDPPSSGRSATTEPASAEVGEDEVGFGSPLSDHLGYKVPGLARYENSEQLELRRRVEEAVGACMRAEGFEYVPWVEDPTDVLTPVDPDVEVESREFAAIYGFGVSTQAYAQRDVGPGLVGHSGDGSGVVVSENPNVDIVGQLDDGERWAYQVAYWGADHPMLAESDSEDGVEVEPDWEPSGCRAEAHRSIGPGQRFSAEFSDEIAEMIRQVPQDERFVSYAREVDRCMIERGYGDFSVEERSLVYVIYDEMLADVEELVGGDPFDELTPEELAAMSPAELDALYDAPRTFNPEARRRLGDIQIAEIDQAVSLWDCGGSESAIRAVEREIQADIERRFVADNELLLVAYRTER